MLLRAALRRRQGRLPASQHLPGSLHPPEMLLRPPAPRRLPSPPFLAPALPHAVPVTPSHRQEPAESPSGTRTDSLGSPDRAFLAGNLSAERIVDCGSSCKGRIHSEGCDPSFELSAGLHRYEPYLAKVLGGCLGVICALLQDGLLLGKAHVHHAEAL